MENFSKCIVHCDDLQVVVDHIQGYFAIRKKEILEDEDGFWPSNREEERQDVFIVSPSYRGGWIEVDINFYQNDIYDYDDWFETLSDHLDTTVIYAYYRSSSATSRLAVFINGTMEISVCHRDEGDEALTLVDATGMDESLANFLKLPMERGDLVYGESIIDYDVIYAFFERFGYTDNIPQTLPITYTYMEREP